MKPWERDYTQQKPWERNWTLERSGPSKLESFASGAADSISFGFGDELKGLVGGLGGIGNEGYNTRRDRITEQSRQYQETARAVNPWSYGTGQVGGAIAGGLGAGAVARGVARGSQLAANLGHRAGQMGPLARIGAATAAGGTGGAIYGAGTASGDQRDEAALSGAAFGAVTGGALRGVGEVGGHFLRNAMPAMSSESAAAREVARMQERFGQSTADLQKAMKTAPQGAMVMDVLEGGTQLTRGAGTRMSAEREVLREALDKRNVGMRDVAVKDLWRVFGGGRKGFSASGTIEDLEASKKALSKPFYDLVEQKVITEVDDEAVNFVRYHMSNSDYYSPAVQRTLKAINRAGPYPGGDDALMREPIFWMRLMEEVNSEWSTLKKAQAMDPLNAPRGTQWKEISAQRDMLAKALRKKGMLGQNYAKAQDIYAGGSRSQEAIELGYKSIKADGDLKAGEVLRELNKLSPGEREQAQFAAIKALVDEMDKAPDLSGRADVLRRIIGTQAKRNTLNRLFDGRLKLDGTFDKRTAIGKLIQRLEAQHKLFQNSVDTGIGVNSHTADKLLAAQSQVANTSPTRGGVRDMMWRFLTGEAADRYDESVSNEILKLMRRPVKEVEREIKKAGGFEQWIQQKHVLAQAAKRQANQANFRAREMFDAGVFGLYSDVGFGEPFETISGVN